MAEGRAVAATGHETGTFARMVARAVAGEAPEDLARELHGLLTPAERLAVLHGDSPFWEGRAAIMEHGYNHEPYVMGEVARLGIPGLRFIDGPRGVVVGHGTAFPVPMARGATWDVDLEEEVGRAIGVELRASGGNLFGGVCVNLPRHPAWGRIQETYSDQSLLLGEMGAALTRGAAEHAIPCVKHLALNSMENARFDVDVRCDEATLQEDYLPHFRRSIDAGAGAVMCAYNSVNGEWASHHAHLLTEVLRDQWGFDGVVISDFIWAIRDAARSLEAGLDIEAPFAQMRAVDLPRALHEGRASWDAVDRSGLRSLATQLRLEARLTGPAPSAEAIASAAHVSLAREVAARSMVLLRNERVSDDAVLPFDGDLASLAVIGPLADVPNLGDHGSSDVHQADVVTALAGLRAALPGASVRHHGGADARAAAELAAECDAAVVVVGLTAADEGEWVNGRVYTRDDLMALYPTPESAADREVRDTMLARAAAAHGRPEIGGDRARLTLGADDVALIRAVAAANPRTVVVVASAGAVLVDEWHHEVPGLVLSWYAGMRGGAALADLLLGSTDFTGRLPYAIPAAAHHLPPFDRDATSVVYDRWYGQRRLQRDGHAALYPLGFGLSYATVRIEDPRERLETEGRLGVSTSVTLAGPRPTHAVVQVYGSRLAGDRAGQRELVGFAVARLEPGVAQRVEVAVDLTPLSRWDESSSSLVCPPGPVCLEVGRHWGDPEAATVVVEV